MVISYLTKVSKRFLKDEDGPTTVEYAVMLALIIAVCVGAAQNMAQATRESFDTSADAIDGAFGP